MQREKYGNIHVKSMENKERKNRVTNRTFINKEKKYR